MPWDPVTAEDGRVYERSAIEQHLTTKRTSPMTNQPMGDRLFPAPQHKNLIEGLIKTGVIGDSLLSSWNEKVKEKKEMEDLLKKANAGDKNVMLTVGLNYRYGEKGFAKDLAKSHILMKKGHDYGNLECTVFLGVDLLTGTGVAQDLMKGMMYTAMAAGNGSDLAAYVLGSALATGLGGVLTVDKDEAIRWLWKASSGTCPVKHLNEMEKYRAKKLLKSLTNKAPATDPSA
ncbi:expressed unknown protein [Seminavis robusta]|uniref:U-box domain-containing protein n=1 Tax=Seminavis robusta TaxID=568900 RepID=A0A9N8DQL0_9STRA|nr:expressed unknown protein [Seminavis robusta]|eukprot:Sro277_g106220.1 n/a (231) ;mRNA; r:24092-24862